MAIFICLDLKRISQILKDNSLFLSFFDLDSGYGPYAILSWMNPIVSCFYGWTGISMVKMTDEEYEAVMERRAKEREEAAENLEA